MRHERRRPILQPTHPLSIYVALFNYRQLYHSIFLKMTTPSCPPKPKLVLMATFTSGSVMACDDKTQGGRRVM